MDTTYLDSQILTTHSPGGGGRPPSVVASFGLGLDSSVMVTLHCCRRGP